MWFFYALLSGILYTIHGLVARHILKGKKDSWAFSFFFSAIGALISLPVMLADFKAASHLYPWVLMTAVGFLIVIQNILQFKSTNHIEASIQGIVQKFRLVWIFLFGVLILHESLTLPKILGTALTIVAGIIVIKKAKKIGSAKGIAYALFATFFYGIVIMSYKFLFRSFNTGSLTFFIFFLPAIMNFILMPNAAQRIILYFKRYPVYTFISCSSGAFANIAMNTALSTGEISKVIVIIEAFLVVTLVGENLFLKENKHVLSKVVAVVLVVIGAILIRLY